MTDNKTIWTRYEESNENNDFVVRKATKEKMKPDRRDNSNNRKRVKYNSKSESDDGKNRCSSADSGKSQPRKPLELETDPAILQRRQKQIDYGKNTVGYYNYTTKVPVGQRTTDDPKTPDKYAKYSRRSWDTLIKIWRKKLHEYDTSGGNVSDEGSDNDNEEQ